MNMSKTNKYLVVHSANTGFAGLENVGVFYAANKEEAIAAAKKQWNLSTGYIGAKLYLIDIDECHNGWSYYT